MSPPRSVAIREASGLARPGKIPRSGRENGDHALHVPVNDPAVQEDEKKCKHEYVEQKLLIHLNLS